LATHHRSGRGAADNAETINQSATFAERATEIADSLNLVNQLAGETVRLIAELQRDYTSTGQPWAAFVAEQFPTWGGRFARTMLIESAATQARLEPRDVAWLAYAVLPPAQRAQFDVRWREAHKPQVVSEGAVVRPAQWQPRSA
jgi:hypothetical protein